MALVSLTGVSKSVGSGPLFEDVGFTIEAGERVGLVGPNGSGKSTLLRLLAGVVEPDDGTIARSRSIHTSALDQRPAVTPGQSVADYLAAAGPEAAQRARVACTQLGLADLTLPLDALSGGMLRKAALARCLGADADLLLLDEPTNHLDLDAVLWLEARLAASRCGFVLVTHDRALLESVCTAILEIADGTVYRHDGNYPVYLRRRADRRAAADAAEDRRVTILRREIEWLGRGPRARTGKDKGRKARAESMLDAGRTEAATLGALPAAQRRLGKKALEIRDIAKSYGGPPVIRGFSYDVTPGERIGVIGPNGSGKTTLLEIVAGRVEPDRGSVVLGETTAVAYLDQTGSRIDGRQTVLDFVTDHAERIRVNDELTLSAEQFLMRFLFPRSMHALTLDRLSGGELRRLSLARLLAGAPNVLLLDEPTNDLDLDTLRVLEDYLTDFSGCLLLVSHDRTLLDRLTDTLLIFDGEGGVRPFVGSYDEYRAERDRLAVAARQTAGPRTTGKARPAGGPAPAGNARSGSGGGADGGPAAAREPRGLSFREQREYNGLPDEIALAEEELRDLEAHFGAATHDLAALAERTRRYHALRDEVERKTARWEELAGRAEE
jgi:ABC transport system ATP-binding/permease protein